MATWVGNRRGADLCRRHLMVEAAVGRMHVHARACMHQVGHQLCWWCDTGMVHTI